MKTIFWLGGFWILFAGVSFAGECPAGYEPVTAAYQVQADDIKKMELSDSSRTEALQKMEAFHGKETTLRTDFRDKAAEFAMMFVEGRSDRSKADALAVNLEDILKELNEAKVNYSLAMMDLLKSGNLRKVRVRPLRDIAHCDGPIAVPAMRRVLKGNEQQVIGITEDEAKYLKDFDRREAYFRSEDKRIRQALDRALRARDVDRLVLQTLLEALAMNTRQEVTNRLDRYFYAEQVLFSLERVDKLNAFDAKHKKQSKASNKAK